MANKNILKNWFKTGLFPTQAQFWEWMDSYWHKDEVIPQNKVQNLTNDLDNKAERDALDSHLIDENAHAALFAKVYTPYKFLTFSPIVDTDEIVLPQLEDAEFDALVYRGTTITEDITLDAETGTLSNWDFKAGVKYIIFYTKI